MASTADFSSFSNIIAGSLRTSTKFHQGVNPSDRSHLWDMPIATEQDLDDAVCAAQDIFPSWSRTPWAERQRLLKQAHEILLTNKDEMAQLIMHEGGKPTQFAGLEVEHALGFLDFHANARELETQIIQDDQDLRISLRHVPIGVIAAICPWNYPLVLAMGKLGAALITGNCVIVKPSPFTPYSILKFIELVHPVFPPGVLQGLNGDDRTGPLMCKHPRISKISFTGTAATGKQIMSAAAETLKNLTLELGGNSASIVCPDVNVQAVAPQIAVGSFFNSGQLCVASKRIYVHKDIYDEFLQVMTDTVKSWKVGPTSMKEIMLGPIQNEVQYQIVKRFFEDSINNGYKFALGGEIRDTKGYIIHPAIIDNPPDESLVVMGEAFGPIVPVQPWSDDDEVIKRVNNTTTGLGGAVWAGDIDRAHALAQRIEAGTIWINSFEKPLPQAFFGGHKESGIGGEWGLHGLLSYCNAQSIHFYKGSVGKE